LINFTLDYGFLSSHLLSIFAPLKIFVFVFYYKRAISCITLVIVIAIEHPVSIAYLPFLLTIHFLLTVEESFLLPGTSLPIPCAALATFISPMATSALATSISPMASCELSKVELQVEQS
jgi:hypothetical protein